MVQLNSVRCVDEKTCKVYIRVIKPITSIIKDEGRGTVTQGISVINSNKTFQKTFRNITRGFNRVVPLKFRMW